MLENNTKNYGLIAMFMSMKITAKILNKLIAKQFESTISMYLLIS